MPDADETQADDHPSLVDNVTRHHPGIGPSAVLLLALIGLGLWLMFAARAAQREAEALRVQSAAAETQHSTTELEAESQTAALASAILDGLAEHLPATVSIASAEGRPGGGVRVAIDAPDPDLLRQSLAGDPWFDRFRERGQEQHDDGGFRITLESR